MGEIQRTIGDWKPSVLLLDFELVPESLRLCFLSFSIHMRLRIVRRLSSLFHALLLWGGGRHVYSVGCRARNSIREVVCAGALLCYSLASTSLEMLLWLGGRVCNHGSTGGMSDKRNG